MALQEILNKNHRSAAAVLEHLAKNSADLYNRSAINKTLS